MNIEARIKKLERVLAPPREYRRVHRAIGTETECEAQRRAMIDAGQAQETDEFIFWIIVDPGVNPILRAATAPGISSVSV